MTATMRAIILHQPHATLVAIGAKPWETRGGPPNGPMRPDGVRGYPGLAIEPGERIAIVAAMKAPLGTPTQDGWTDPIGDYRVRRQVFRKRGGFVARDDMHLVHMPDGDLLPLPLGRVVCTAVVAEALPIHLSDEYTLEVQKPNVVWVVEDGSGPFELTHQRDDLTETDISDQLPYGHWEPGRWAWRLTDVEAVDGPVEVTRGSRQGVFETAVTW